MNDEVYVNFVDIYSRNDNNDTFNTNLLNSNSNGNLFSNCCVNIFDSLFMCCCIFL
jgi:hypothetical protein